MLVTDYEASISELYLHALMILPTEAEIVRRFVAGLLTGIQSTMAREVEMGTSYELVVEIARKIEGIRQQSREQVTRDKRFRYSGEFRGAPSGGRAIQGSSSGYSGHQGQTSSQQLIAPKGCYGCGDRSQMRRFCPRLWGRPVQQGQQPMITAPVAPPVVRPPRGKGHVGKGRPRGGGQLGGGQLVGAPARFYAFLARPDAKASDAMITDYHAKTVTLAIPVFPKLEWKGLFVSSFNQVISFIKAQHMVERGCLAYLAYVRDTTAETPAIDSVHVVREFSDVFPSDLPDTLSRKAESMGSLAFILVDERPLASDIQSLANRLVRLDISEPS
ncbi:uncharacterized protein [Nicotiana tomentosiformis]|uniref:uncharacterized protein n=1 Tax=Nicotiana tomentosiformis TaxID=4098 RepID=UPI00388C81AF